MSGPRWIPAMLLVTAFQVISFAQVIFTDDGTNMAVAMVMIIFLAVEWVYAIFSSIIHRKNGMALECIAFFLSGIGLAISAAQGTSLMITQFIAILLGMGVFIGLLWIISDVERADKFILPAEIFAIVLLALGLVISMVLGAINGAYNWIKIGGFSFQPSEIVKIPFVFVGAASLEKIQSTKSIKHYVAFAVLCIGLLFLEKDLGTALIFFVAFLVLAFMRSGDVRTIIFIVVAAAMLAAMVVLVRSDYVMNRFSTYRHIWDDPYGSGFQQTHALTYAVSGGLAGMGLGGGYLRNLSAATEDLIFGVVCEELGLLIGFLVAACYLLIFVHAIRNSKGSTSAFYSIATCAAGALILFQASMNIFGVSDFLPFTGVTLPFVSRGGSSMISCWGMLAFIKAADNRTWAKGKKGGLKKV